MIDFFGNLPPENKEKKLKFFRTHVTHINIDRPELSELKANLAARMKVSLPKSENHKIQQPEKPATQRTRRGESASLF